LTPSTALVLVRIAWVGAILAGVVAILVGLASGTNGGNSSMGSPRAGFGPGFAFEAQENPESANAAAPRADLNQRSEGQIPGESRLSSGPPRASGDKRPADELGGAGGSTPVATPQPAPRPKPTPAPRPKPKPAPPQTPVESQPAVTVAVQPSITVANNNDGP
jgi:hypothetical protein